MMRGRVVIVILLLLIVAATSIVYWPARKFDFVNYDDDLYVTANPQVQRGLQPDTIAWAFTTLHASNWHPLTWLSHLSDTTLFNSDTLNPGARHVVNAILHVINAVLLLLLLQRLTGATWRSALVAGLFAVHPLHVESVAWIAERKDVLSIMFGLVCMHAYCAYAQQRTVGRYLLLALMLALSLLAKPMLVTLPLLLLLLDRWPLRRTERLASAATGPLVLEKIPLLFIVGASALITVVAQSHGPALKSIDEYTIGVRIANAIVSYGWYLGHAVWPMNLAVGYPHPRAIEWPALIASFAALASISGICVFVQRRAPHLLVGWLWFVVGLVPVIGLVQVGSQARADRYMYFPSIGLYIMLAWSLPALRHSPAWMRATVATFALGLVIGAAWVTSRQVLHWRDGVALFSRALDVNGPTAMISGNLGAALMASGDVHSAIPHLEQALLIDSSEVVVRNNLGIALLSLQRIQEAREQFARAAQTDPQHLNSRHNLGLLELDQGNIDAAIGQFQAALRIDPDAIGPRLGGIL